MKRHLIFGIETSLNHIIEEVRELVPLAELEGIAVEYNKGRIKSIEDLLFELRTTYEAYSLSRKIGQNTSEILNKQLGTIEHASWEKSKRSGKPYIKLTIKLPKPILVHGEEWFRVFRALPLISYHPSGESPIEELEEAIGVHIKIDPEKGITQGQEIPELIGKTLMFDLQEEFYMEKWYLRAGHFYPPEENKK